MTEPTEDAPQTALQTTTPTPTTRSSVTIPILISAIANIIFAYLWLATCVGVIFTAPMITLAIFEFIFYAKSPQMTNDEFVSRATTLGVFEILVGLFNLVSIICGIIVLIHTSRIRAENALPQTG